MSYDFLGKGLRYPFRFQSVSGGTQVSTATSREHEHIRESILQILGTRIGERFMNPEFGSRLKDLVFEQNDEVLKGLLRHYVIDAIKRWEKRVIITEVRFDDRPLNIDGNLLLVHIAYRVIQSQVDGNLVYPFYREDPNNPAPSYPQPEPEPEPPPVRSVRLSPDVRSLFNLLWFDAAEMSPDPDDSLIWPAGEYEVAYIEGAFQDRNGKWIVKQHTAKGRFGRALKRISEWCRLHRHAPIREQWKGLEQKLRGHFGYFGITGNFEALARFAYEATKAWHKWLSRRSQRGMPWARMNRLLKRYPLPSPKILHHYA